MIGDSFSNKSVELLRLAFEDRVFLWTRAILKPLGDIFAQLALHNLSLHIRPWLFDLERLHDDESLGYLSNIASRPMQDLGEPLILDDALEWPQAVPVDRVHIIEKIHTVPAHRAITDSFD